MSKRRNKIEAELGADRLTEFLTVCAKTPGLTLQKIQDLAKDKYGVKVSLMGAKTFRDNTFEGYLARLRKASEFARTVAELQTQAPGVTYADAAANIMGQELFERLQEHPQILDKLQDVKPGELAYFVKCLRIEDRRIQSMQLQIDKFQAEQMRRAKELERVTQDAAAKKARKGQSGDALSLDTINRIRGIYGLSPVDNGTEGKK